MPRTTSNRSTEPDLELGLNPTISSRSPPPAYTAIGTAHVITIPMETFTVLTPPTDKEKERMEKWSKFVAFCKEMAKFLLKVLIIVGIIAGLTCAVSAAIGSR